MSFLNFFIFADPGIWAVSALANPVTPYVTGEVQCNSGSNRRKRSLTSDNQEFTIGLLLKFAATSKIRKKIFIIF